MATDLRDIVFYKDVQRDGQRYRYQFTPGHANTLLPLADSSDYYLVEFPDCFIDADFDWNGGYKDNNPIQLMESLEHTFKIDLAEMEQMGSFTIGISPSVETFSWTDVAQLIYDRGEPNPTTTLLPFTFFNNRWEYIKYITDLETVRIYTGFQLPSGDAVEMEYKSDDGQKILEYEVKLVDPLRAILGDIRPGDSNTDSAFLLATDSATILANPTVYIPVLGLASSMIPMQNNLATLSGRFVLPLLAKTKNDPYQLETNDRTIYENTFYMIKASDFMDRMNTLIISAVYWKYRFYYDPEDYTVVPLIGNPFEYWNLYKQDYSYYGPMVKGDAIAEEELYITSAVWDGVSHSSIDFDWYLTQDGWLSGNSLYEIIGNLCKQTGTKLELDRSEVTIGTVSFIPNWCVFNFIPINRRINTTNIVFSDTDVEVGLPMNIIKERDNNSEIVYYYNSNTGEFVEDLEEYRLIAPGSIQLEPAIEIDGTADNFQNQITHGELDEDGDLKWSPFRLVTEYTSGGGRKWVVEAYKEGGSNYNGLFYLEDIEYNTSTTETFGILPANSISFSSFNSEYLGEYPEYTSASTNKTDKRNTLEYINSLQSNNAYSDVWTQLYSQIVGQNSKLTTIEISVDEKQFEPYQLGYGCTLDLNTFMGLTLDTGIPTQGIITKIDSYDVAKGVFEISIALINNTFNSIT